jgi:hypothetical protein
VWVLRSDMLDKLGFDHRRCRPLMTDVGLSPSTVGRRWAPPDPLPSVGGSVPKRQKSD